jgi:hypothetical protein
MPRQFEEAPRKSLETPGYLRFVTSIRLTMTTGVSRAIAKFVQSPQSPGECGDDIHLIAGKADDRKGGASCGIRSGTVSSSHLRSVFTPVNPEQPKVPPWL